MKRCATLLPLALLLAIAGCHKAAAPATGDQAKPASQAPGGKAHRFFSNGVSPQIVSVTPSTVIVHDGHLSAWRYHVEYDIQGIEKATHARMVVYSPGYGELKRVDLPLESHGAVDLMIDSAEADLGPVVRLRVHCPAGTSDWYTMGTLQTDWVRHTSNVLQIGSFSPQYVGRSNSDAIFSGVPIEVWGQRIERGCKADAEVDGQSVDLVNVTAVPHQLKALLLSSTLNGRPVVARYLEVKLQISGPEVAVEDIEHIDFEDH